MTRARALLVTAAGQLRQAGVATPEVDAELLLAHAAGVPRGRLALLDAVAPPVAEVFAALVRRRVTREPLQHIVGSAPFRHELLAVGPGVFVPRPETELLVDAVLPVLRSVPAPVAVDLCAGSGALALAIAGEVPGCRVWALERSPAALVWLRRNVAASAQEASVTVLPGDVGDPLLTESGGLAGLRGRVDAIVANPPYVPAGVAVPPEVGADPPDSVFAPGDGLAVVRAVVARAVALLRPGGVLAVEHDDSQADAVSDLFGRSDAWAAARANLDLAGRPRFAVAVRR